MGVADGSTKSSQWARRALERWPLDLSDGPSRNAVTGKAWVSRWRWCGAQLCPISLLRTPLSSPKLRCGSLGQLQSIAGDACGAAEVKEGGTE